MSRVPALTPAVRLARAEKLVDRADIVELLEDLLPTGGRPRQLPVRALLVGLALLALSDAPQHLDRVAGVLNTLPGTDRARLGVLRTTTQGASVEVTTRQVQRLYAHLTAGLDGSPHYTGRNLPAGERAHRDVLLQHVLDRLLEASLPAGYTHTGDYALDATIVDAWARPEATRYRRAMNRARQQAARTAAAHAQATGADPATAAARVAADTDAVAAAAGVPVWGELADGDQRTPDARPDRRRDHRMRRAKDRDAATIFMKGKLRHAYALHFATWVPTEQHVADRLAAHASPGQLPPPPVPNLVERMVVTAATASPAKAAVRLFRNLAAGHDAHNANLDSAPADDDVQQPAHRRLGDIVTDRGYSSSVPENFHFPLRALGAELIFDLHPIHRGITGYHEGAVILDGELYSPGILNYPALLDLTPPPIGGTRADWTAYHADIALRAPFRLRDHGRPGPDGHARRGCPAAVRPADACPARPASLTLLGRAPEVFDPPAGRLPKVCTAQTLTIAPDVLARAQRHPYGSTAWYDSYHRRRPRVEGSNGLVKNPALGHLAPGRIRVRGLAKFSLLAAFCVAAANLRFTDTWTAHQTTWTRRRDNPANIRPARRRRRTDPGLSRLAGHPVRTGGRAGPPAEPART